MLPMEQVVQKLTPAQPHRWVAMFAVLALFATVPLSAFVVLRTLGDAGQARAAEPVVPLIDKQDVVVIGERKVCSFMGSGQTSVGVVGEDGGESVKVGTTSYFGFGDTITNFNTILPNTVATSTDTDAADCVPMTTKSSAGRAVPMLPKLASECTVWPLDMVNAVGSDIHFFYYSWNNTCNFEDSGRIALGLGRMNSTTLATTRVNNLFWLLPVSSNPSSRALKLISHYLQSCT
jgi:hypothetical protein